MIIMWAMPKSLLKLCARMWGWNSGSINYTTWQILNHCVLNHLHNGDTMVIITLEGCCED